jgi:hypothetical protein
VASTATGRLEWSSPPLLGSAGEAAGLVLGDADREGFRELLVATAGSVRAFEHRPSGADVAAPSFAAGALQAEASPCCPGVDLRWPAADDDERPPVRYEIHRSSDPAFVPDATTLVAVRSGGAFRDADLAPGLPFAHAVVPVDGAGNRGAELRAVTSPRPPAIPPDAPTNLQVVDPDPCVRSPLVVTFDHPAGPPDVVFHLQVDGAIATLGITSPHEHAAGTDLRAYAVVAENPTCGLLATSTEVLAADSRQDLPPPWVRDWRDLADCAATGVEITFSHPGFGAGTGHYELVELPESGGEVVVASPITSPWVHAPPDDAWRRYGVVAVSDACPDLRDALFAPVWMADWAGTPEPLVILGVDDPRPCLPGLVRLEWDGPILLPVSSHFELWRDGVPWKVPFLELGDDFFDPGDDLPHDWVVRTVDDTCGGFADSAPFRWADGQACVPAAPSLRLGVFTSGILSVDWELAEGAVGHDVHVGTLDSLWTRGAYDHVPDPPGVTFPTAPDPASGCDATFAPASLARIDGLQGGSWYVLVVARGTPGLTSGFGRDGFGRERADVDPRPVETLCP